MASNIRRAWLELRLKYPELLQELVGARMQMVNCFVACVHDVRLTREELTITASLRPSHWVPALKSVAPGRIFTQICPASALEVDSHYGDFTLQWRDKDGELNTLAFLLA